MRLVMAVLRPAQLEAVRQALAAVHVTRLTICDAQGHATAAAAAPGTAGVTQQAVMEIAVNDDFLDDRLFVLPMHDAVQIYRDVRGPEAL